MADENGAQAGTTTGMTGNLLCGLLDWRFRHYLTMQLLPVFYLLLIVAAVMVIAPAAPSAPIAPPRTPVPAYCASMNAEAAPPMTLPSPAAATSLPSCAANTIPRDLNGFSAANTANVKVLEVK